MRGEHKAGDTVPIVDEESGELRPAYLFVAVLGASSMRAAIRSPVIEPPQAEDVADLECGAMEDGDHCLASGQSCGSLRGGGRRRVLVAQREQLRWRGQ